MTKTRFDAIKTWVVLLTRTVHFITSKVKETAVDVENYFFDHIFRLYGLPDDIISDGYPKFTSRFWTHLMDICVVKMRVSRSYHPQTDGASEVINRMVENC